MSEMPARPPELVPVTGLRSPWVLPASVCITGACVLIMEVLGTRILAPYFGNTIFTVSSVISVTLGALSAGYYIGGVCADRWASFRIYSIVIICSGVVVTLSYAASTYVLPLIGQRMPITSGPFLSSLVLMFVPALLLGTISPFAVKLQSTYFPDRGVGRIAGEILFWSTGGSIAGSLATGFVLIPRFAIDTIVVGAGATVSCTGAALFLYQARPRMRAIAALLTLPVLHGLPIHAARPWSLGVLYEEEGVYSRVKIHDGVHEGRPTRFLQLDRSMAGAMFLDASDPGELAFDYSRYYVLYRALELQLHTALVLGGGAYSLPKALLNEAPDVRVHVAEIEPRLFDLAKQFFRARDDPRLIIDNDDARRILARATTRYDLVFADAFSTVLSIPPHLTTVEFFALVRSRLNEAGIFIANINGSLDDRPQSFTLAAMKTFRSVFANSYFFAIRSPEFVGLQNILFVGINGPRRLDLRTPKIVNRQDMWLQSLVERQINVEGLEWDKYQLLTDNFAPVEYMTAKELHRVPRWHESSDKARRPIQ